MLTLRMVKFIILGSDKAKKAIDLSLNQFASDEPLLRILVQQFELFSM